MRSLRFARSRPTVGAVITGVVAPAFTALAAVAILPTHLGAQQASFVYLLGKDTVAIEQFTRTASAITGGMVQRSGAAVALYRYSMQLGRDGRPTSASISRLLADGTLPANAPTETRFRVTSDSVVRENVWPDSTQRRAFAAKGAMVNFPTYVFGPTELLARIRRTGGVFDSVPALGLGGGLGTTGLLADGPTSARLRGGAYAMLLRFDGSDRLLSVDGSGTTNKMIGTRGAGGLDLAVIARGMKPTGTLSRRDIARGAFGAGGMVIVDYSRPHVRERTVWGGTLVPFDSVWRAGANDATHLFTTRTLTFGDSSTDASAIAPGMYTLWVQHTRTGTFLIVNRQTGQWGTGYAAENDVARIPMRFSRSEEFVEELTYEVRAVGQGRGALSLAWGDSVASVTFAVSVAMNARTP